MTALELMKQEAKRINEMKIAAIKDGTNKITIIGLDGKPRSQYYHSMRWNDRPSTVANYK